MHMKAMARFLISLPLIAVAGFCVFGFLASFEPGTHQWSWRGTYGLAFLFTVWGMISIWRRP
ncbi:MAG: hypothetical protein K8R92_08530 [Planctomycetes bacterium]|nr:hypothetical protein [Planctomycetota bacterium]